MIAPGKSRCTVVGPALPRTPLDASQGVSGPNCAFTRTTTLLLSRVPQMFAAVWKTKSRCAPTVVPGFPPTGEAGAGSLNPSPAPSALTIVMVAAWAGTGASGPVGRSATAKAAAANFESDTIGIEKRRRAIAVTSLPAPGAQGRQPRAWRSLRRRRTGRSDCRRDQSEPSRIPGSGPADQC